MLRENLKDVNITQEYVRTQVNSLVNTIITDSAEQYKTMWSSQQSTIPQFDSEITRKLVHSFKAADAQIIMNVREQLEAKYKEKLKAIDELMKTLKYVDTEEYLDIFIARVRSKQLQ